MSASPNTALPAQESIGEAWPVTTPSPAPARGFGWLLLLPACVGVLFIPGRIGHRLAQSSWIKAILAFMVSAVLASLSSILARLIEFCAEAATYSGGSTLTVSQMIRLPFADAVTLVYVGRIPASDVRLILLAIGGGLAGVFVLPLLIMPFISAGERLHLLYGRTVKLLMWSSVCAVPIALALATVDIWDRTTYIDEESVMAAIRLCGVAWWLTVVHRLGARYAGRPEGPAWTPRTALCCRCGYELQTLPVEGRCPECGCAVRDSMPEAKRPSAFAAATTLGGSVRGFARTIWAVTREPEFFLNLQVLGPMAPAVRFAGSVLMLSATLMVGSILLYILRLVLAREEGLVNPAVPMLAFVAGVYLSLMVLLALAVFATTAFRKRDMRPRVQVLCYCTPVPMLPLVLGCLALAVSMPLDLHETSPVIQLSVIPPTVVVFAIVWTVRRLRRGFRDVRYASA